MPGAGDLGEAIGGTLRLAVGHLIKDGIGNFLLEGTGRLILRIFGKRNPGDVAAILAGLLFWTIVAIAGCCLVLRNGPSP